MQIREIALTELDTAFELVRELRTGLDYDTFEDRIYAMRHQEYKMFGTFERDVLLCYAGFSVLTSLAHGRHLYLFDFVTTLQRRSEGLGSEMMHYLYDYAKIHKCGHIVLSSGEQRKDAHRFYEREGFEGCSKFFIKTL